jgi:hypothetical protein
MLGRDDSFSQVAGMRADQAVPVESTVWAEILVLRHQLSVLRRKAPKRMAFSSIDRLAHISEVCTINTSGFDLR